VASSSQRRLEGGDAKRGATAAPRYSAAMPSALSHVAWEASLVEPGHDRAMEAYARRRLGVPHATVRYFLAAPWVARAVVDLHVEFGLLLKLDQRTADLIGLVVSQENSCRFCYAIVRSTLWLQGMDAERIRRVEQDFGRADLAPRAQAAIAYARAQSRSGPAGAKAAWQTLRDAGIDTLEAKEIAFTVAVTDFSNRTHTMVAAPYLPAERMPQHPLMRLLRPVLDRVLSRHRSRGAPAAATPADPALPYGGLVAAFAGSPIAAALQRLLGEMWASPLLSRRCKLLMFAVVSRGLPCEVCELEITRALQREGLAAETVERILGRLDAPELDATERLLLPLARETLWYEPAVLQRRVRALRDTLSPPQLIEAIGVAALANALCRMTAAVLAAQDA
jgi:AhpD family alkylhydroperoxidase